MAQTIPALNKFSYLCTQYKLKVMASFIADKIVMDGLTYDDVLLIPAYSEVLPKEVELKTQFSRNITLNVPIVTAAMDTVTESQMAIAMAKLGGIGVIHKNLTPENQAQHVARVKHFLNGMIEKPVTFRKNMKVYEIITERENCNYKFSGFPIVDDDGKLVGLFTNRDLKYLVGQGDTLVKEVMTKRNLVTAPQGTSLAEAKRILWQHRIEKLPIVDEHGHLKGLITSKDIDNAVNYPNACKDEQGRLRVGAAVGVSANTSERVDALVKAGVDVIVVDSAHGHSQGILNTVAKIRAAHPDLQIIAGNIVTAEAAKDLIKAGANTVKVGVGPGSICTTRVVAGVGVPQITAVMDCAEVAHKRPCGPSRLRREAVSVVHLYEQYSFFVIS